MGFKKLFLFGFKLDLKKNMLIHMCIHVCVLEYKCSHAYFLARYFALFL